MTNLSTFAVVMYTSLVVSGAGTTTEVSSVDACPCCGNPVEQTICVPTWVTEKRVCKQTQYREEVRERVCKVRKCVPVQKEGVVKYTEFVQKKVENKREVEISTPVCKVVEQKYKILVPAKDKVTKTRMVTKCVPVTETKIVCENGCEKECTVTCNKEICVEETYECEVDVCAEVEQTRKVEAWETKKEKKTVVDTCLVVVAEPKTKKVPVTVMEEVEEDKVETYTVCVPYEVDVEVDCCVLKMVPTTVPCGCR